MMDLVGILVLALIWGASFLFIKVGLNGGMSPVLVAVWRLAVGMALMWAIVLIRRLLSRGVQQRKIPLDRATWGKIAIVGLLNKPSPLP